jgi:hypothetical protein
VTGTGWLTTVVRVCTTVRDVRTERLDRTVRVAPRRVGVDAGADAVVGAAEAGAWAGPKAPRNRCTFGTATCGKVAVESESAGIGAGAADVSSSARIAEAMIVTYGSASDAARTRANQNRCRRVPSPLRPSVPRVPKP